MVTEGNESLSASYFTQRGVHMGIDLKKLADDTGKNIHKGLSDAGKNLRKAASKTGETVKWAAKDPAKAASTAVRSAGNAVRSAGDAAGDFIDNTKKNGFLNAGLRKHAVKDYNQAVSLYTEKAKETQEASTKLYELRNNALLHVQLAESHINSLANTPKKFETDLQEIRWEIEDFTAKTHEITEAEKEAKIAGEAAGIGSTVSALGVAVATLGPTAAMGIATTFGTASTGAAIATLSGAAAENAALAWLGGGALAAGGGGMAAGDALLALAGPVGWAIAGVALAGTVAAGNHAAKKNQTDAQKAIEERERLEVIIRNLELVLDKIHSLYELTQEQISLVDQVNAKVTGLDYQLFNQKEKEEAGILVNHALVLAQLINQEIQTEEPSDKPAEKEESHAE